MEEIIKSILYYIVLLGGTINLLALISITTIRMIGVAIDHLKIGKVMFECLEIYKERKCPVMKVDTNNIKREKFDIQEDKE